MTHREYRIVWSFLIGVTLIEGWVLLASFLPKGDLVHGLIRYSATPSGTSVAWACAMAVVAGYSGYAAWSSPVIARHMLKPLSWGPYAAIRFAAIPMALVSGFFEEAFFRKTLMDAAMHRDAGIAAQIALTALAFGAVHAVWGAVRGSIRDALGPMLATGTLGALLGAIYIIGGRSIGPCIAAHTLINLLIEPWLIIAAATNSWTRRKATAPA